MKRHTEVMISRVEHRLVSVWTGLFLFLSPAANAWPAVESVARGLDVPWALAFAPDGRIFVTERRGRIRVVEGGVLRDEPWLEFEVYDSGEAGLMGLALDPEFERNGFVYVVHTYLDREGRVRNRLLRLREDAARRRGVLERVLVDEMKGASTHNGARVKFGPDRKLYWTMGDAQEPRLAQDLSSLNGKILRINPDGTIPPDNPFKDSPVYSYGHRNPQGLAWQPGTARLYATEHGPSGFLDCCRDEVNYIEPGKNYGWPVIRGYETRPGMVPPILHSGNDQTWAPAGAAFVTSGPWSGSFVFTGLRGRALYRLALDRNDPRRVAGFERLFRGEFGRLREVVEGPDAALYVLTSNQDGRGSPQRNDDRLLRITVK